MTIELKPADFAAKLAEVGEKTGQTLTDTSGTISHSGVTAAYFYEPDVETLTINITKKPFLVSESYIEKQITAWFAGS